MTDKVQEVMALVVQLVVGRPTVEQVRKFSAIYARLREVVAPPVPEPNFPMLCQAWGESDLPCAFIAYTEAEVRKFIVNEWLGDDTDTYVDTVLADLRGHDWKDEPEWNAEFEIGGVSFKPVYESSARVVPTEAPHTQPASEPVAQAVTRREFHEYEGSAKQDTIGYLTTDVRWLKQPVAVGTLDLYATPQPAAKPAQAGAWKFIPAETICDLIEKHRLKATSTTETFKDEALHQLLRDVVDAASEALAMQVSGSEKPAFHGFMDEENCCVHLCFTPHAPRLTDGKFATAYYAAPSVIWRGEKL